MTSKITEAAEAEMNQRIREAQERADKYRAEYADLSAWWKAKAEYLRVKLAARKEETR